MVVALETKNMEKFIDGTLCPPITDPFHEAWCQSNRMVMSWLTRSMTPSIKKSVIWMDTTSVIWRDLKDRFSHADKFKVSNFQDHIHACHQGDFSVSEYYTKLKILWKELKLYRCVLSCNCLTPYACGLLAKLHKEREDDYVIQFLCGLNESYAQVRSQIMIMDPMPLIVKTFSMVLQHEREFIGTNPKHPVSDSLAFTIVSNAQPRFNSSNKNKPNTKASASLVEVDSSASLQQLDLDGSPSNDQFTFSKDQYQAILACSSTIRIIHPR
ncbi:hypothetical protein V8G54_006529 [Vigna mungo]|uniref:Retrotransposon gag domain-containing protein n=1 Tax=Vigna mungo TaxID=3915 RepID=A0AAQ3P2B9_VIGMU